MLETNTSLTYETLSIQDLRQALSDPITETALRFRGWVMENLSIDPNTRLTPWKNGTRWLNISDPSGYKAKVCIPKAVWSRAVEKGYEITNDVAIDVALNTISLDKWMQVQIEALAIRVSGQSKLEALRESIIKYCEQKQYFTRPRKPLPIIIRKVAIITTVNSTIESDITSQIGIRKEFISDYRFNGTAADLKATIEQLGRRREHDIIALYRGGREDEYMFVYSDPQVLDAVVQSPIPAVTAIGHERDTPPVQLVADMGFASPTKFAEYVRQKNDDALYQAELCLKNIQQSYQRYLMTLESHSLHLIGTINAKASELTQKHETRKHKRTMAMTIAAAAALIAAIIAFFLLRA